MMPRPGVDFPIDVALIDSDRQAISNGITTVFPPRPGRGNLVFAARTMRGNCWNRSSDAAAARRRHPLPFAPETYNLDAESEIIDWLGQGRVDLFAFNDHMDSTIASLTKPLKRSRMVERTGLTNEAFDPGAKRGLPRPRRAGVDRTAGAGGAYRRCPDDFA